VLDGQHQLVEHDYNNQLTLLDISILNENNLEKIEVPGLNEIIQTRIKKIEYIAFVNDKKTFKPFFDSFNGKNFIQMVETLSEISGEDLPTSGKNLIIELTFENDIGALMSELILFGGTSSSDWKPTKKHHHHR
jgi:hypothetical protein